MTRPVSVPLSPVACAVSKYIIGLALLVFLVGTLAAHGEENELPLEAGDVVFLSGNSWRSQAIRLSAGGTVKYTHVGLVVETGEVPQVAHSSPDNPAEVLTVVPWEAFVSIEGVKRASLYRAVEGIDLAPVLSQARAFIEAEVPFDHRFGNGPEALYCTEFIAEVFAAGGYDLVEDRVTSLSALFAQDPVIFPDALTQSKFLSVVITLTYE